MSKIDDALKDSYSKEYWTKYHGDNDYSVYADYTLKHSDWYFKILLNLEEHVGWKKGRCLLEVASSYGHFLNYARGRNWDVKGVDISEYANQQARKKYKLDVQTSAIEDYESMNKYDAIVMMNVLEHTVFPKLVMEKVRALLQPNGIVMVSVPNLRGAIWHFPFWEHRMFHDTHFHYFTPKTLRKCFEDAGLEVLDLRCFMGLRSSMTIYGRCVE